MQEDLYFYLMLLGLVIAGLAWLLPGRKPKGVNQPPQMGPKQHERQYQEMLQLAAAMKQEADKKMSYMTAEIEGLKKRLEEAENNTREGFSLHPRSTRDTMQLHDRYGEIFSLHREGKTTEQIASQMDMGTGEVALILQLQSISAKPERKM